MAEQKTRENDRSVEQFLNRIEDEKKRQDCFVILSLMQQITGYPPRMWGDSIVGFGSIHYKYATGHEGDMALTGFSPRKQNLTIYIQMGFERYPDLMAKLGKFKTGKSCLYIKTVEDIDLKVLGKLVERSVKEVQDYYPRDGQDEQRR